MGDNGCGRVYICPVCGKRFTKLYSFKQHLRKHIVYNTCPVCRKQFDTYMKLVRHIMKMTLIEKDEKHIPLGILLKRGTRVYNYALNYLLQQDQRRKEVSVKQQYP